MFMHNSFPYNGHAELFPDDSDGSLKELWSNDARHGNVSERSECEKKHFKY